MKDNTTIWAPHHGRHANIWKSTTSISLPIICSRCGKKLGEYLGEIFYADHILCAECYLTEGMRQ